MKKILSLVAFALLLVSPAQAWIWESGYQSDTPDANQIRTDITNFNNNLSIFIIFYYICKCKYRTN